MVKKVTRISSRISQFTENQAVHPHVHKNDHELETSQKLQRSELMNSVLPSAK